MTDEKKPLKIEFAPGAFDSFEGTQEELDELVAEITSMFQGKSSEELLAMSNRVEDDDWDELPDDVKAQIIRAHDSFEDDGEDLADEFKRRLQ